MNKLQEHVNSLALQWDTADKDTKDTLYRLLSILMKYHPNLRQKKLLVY